MKTIVYLLSVSLLSCADVETIKHQSQTNIEDSTFFRLEYENDSTYKIRWGTSEFNNLSTSSFEVLGSGAMELELKGKNAIILSQSCGMSCKKSIVLPLKKGYEERVYQRPLAFDLENCLVAFSPVVSEHELSVEIENFISRKHISQTLSELCPAADPFDCIDTSYFQNGQLVVDYEGGNWTNENRDLQRRTFFVRF